MFEPLDGPALQGNDSVDTSTPKELKVGGSAMADRKVITLQPQDGGLWVYFGEEGVTPSAATVAVNGFDHAKRAKDTYEVGPRQPVWVLSQSGTVSYRFAERG